MSTQSINNDRIAVRRSVGAQESWGATKCKNKEVALAVFDVKLMNNDLVVSISGALEFNDHDAFKDQVLDRIEIGNAKIIHFDFSNLEHIDSAGLGLLSLLADSKKVKETVASLVIDGAKGQVGKMLKHARMDRFFAFVVQDDQ